MNQTALHVAILKGNDCFVKQLLDSGASPIALYFDPSKPGASEEKGYRPIHMACQVGSKNILSFVLLSIFENISNY